MENQVKPRRTKCIKVGNYLLGKTLGEGTFGKVKLGIHQLTQERVAVKVLEKARIVDVADIERVTREIHILKLIRHPNIIQLYEIIETARQLYLIMEYANGGELFDYIVAKKRVREADACQFFKQIVYGVEYVHQLGVVHRDLKPENLLLDSGNTIKIVDFGLSNTYKPEELLKTACGSPCYAAPEMIAGERYECKGVDVWSCGVILFALVCGYLPFEDNDTGRLYKKILQGSYEFPHFISEDAKSLISGILTTDPKQRLTIEQIKQHKWFRKSELKDQRGLVVGYDQIPIDQSALDQLEEYGLDPIQAKQYIEANKHNHLTTAYYLLHKKQLRLGIKHVKRPQQEQNTTPQPTSTYRNSSPHPPLPNINLDTPISPILMARRSNYIKSRRQASVIESSSINQSLVRPRHLRHSSLSPALPQTRKRSRTNKRGNKGYSPIPPSTRENYSVIRNRLKLSGRVSESNKENRDQSRLKVRRGVISIQTDRNPRQIFNELTKQMETISVKYKLTQTGKMKGTYQDCKFTIFVTPHEYMQKQYYVNISRMAGDLWAYKTFCDKIISNF